MEKMKEDHKQSLESMQAQLTQTTKEMQEFKEKSVKAIQTWILKFAFLQASEKQEKIAREDVRIGSVVLQQMGHRVVETWREGDVPFEKG